MSYRQQMVVNECRFLTVYIKRMLSDLHAAKTHLVLRRHGRSIVLASSQWNVAFIWKGKVAACTMLTSIAELVYRTLCRCQSTCAEQVGIVSSGMYGRRDDARPWFN